MEIITGGRAIAEMRKLRFDDNKYFILYHQTYNDTTGKSNGMRIVNRCRMRVSLPKELFKKNTDLFLPYYDLEKNKNGMAYKILLRYVAFPPDYKLLKITWFPEN